MEKRTWVCGDCGMRVEWSYDDLAYRGIPNCPNCDCDMLLEKE